MAQDADTKLGGPYRGFPDTRISLINAAAGDHTLSRNAMEAIVAAYWKPAYKHVRTKWRRPNEDAKDLIQGFFAAFSAPHVLARFDPARGSFRNFVRACLDHHVIKQHEYDTREKRGGAVRTLDFDEAERELAATPDISPEEVFFREWRRQIFALAVDDLRNYAISTGRDLQYRVFEQYDLADGDRPRYADIALEHGIAETTVVNYLAWARRELRRRVMERLSKVTAGEAELRSETRVLLR